jgi:hypothetical protein
LPGYLRSAAQRGLYAAGRVLSSRRRRRRLELGEFGRLLNSGKIEDLRKIAETMTKNAARVD